MSEDDIKTVVNDPDKWMSIYQNAVNESHESIADEISRIKFRYETVKYLDQGASKEIFKVKDNMTGRFVAMAHPVKGSSEKHIEKFLQEGRLHSTLEHPNIIPVYDYGLTDNRPFFTMKLIGGKNLKQHLKANPELSLEDRLNIFISICNAISYCHSIGIIHCDLKPENIQISNFGEVLVCDWGLAKFIDAEEDCDVEKRTDFFKTLDGELKGTPGYMAPEQAEGKNSLRDERSDIFSLGTVFYELLTFSMPHTGSELVDILKKTITGDVILPRDIDPNIPESLEAICLKAMEVKQEDRYQKVFEMVNDINAFRNNFSTSAEESGLLNELRLFYKRNRKSVLTAITALAVLITATAFFIQTLQTKNFEAVQAKNKAIESEMKLREEQLERNNLMTRLIPKQIADLTTAILKHEHSYAQNMIERVLLLEPDHKKALYYKGLSLVARSQFEEAEKAFDSCSHAYSAECKKFLSNPDLLKSFIHRGSFWNRNPQREIEHALMLQVYLSRADISLEDRLIYMKEALQRDNPNDITVNWKLDQGLRIDLSGNQNLWDIRPLKNFIIHTLDLSNTSVSDLWMLESAQIKNLDISQTKVIDLSPLITYKNLESLKFSNTGTRNIHMLRKVPLKKIDTSFSEGFNLRNLNPSVEEIIIYECEIHNPATILELTNLKRLVISVDAKKTAPYLKSLQGKGVNVVFVESIDEKLPE